jgi:hypothetical protein
MDGQLPELVSFRRKSRKVPGGGGGRRKGGRGRGNKETGLRKREEETIKKGIIRSRVLDSQAQ